MDYKQSIDYLNTQFPVFAKIGAAAMTSGLENIINLCSALGDPHQKIKTIHVAGTNGKGSTSHMLAAVLQSAGYKTGLFTTPYLKDFREQIRINGEMISETYISAFIADRKETLEQAHPSLYEVTVAMAFSYFADQETDIAIIEVGLGGKSDSTNIITPELSIITNISFDHMNILGSSLDKIASEKAGIIKESVPVVVGEKQHQSDIVFLEKAVQCGSELIFADLNLHTGNIRHEAHQQITSVYHQDTLLFENIILDLGGHYQLKNLLTVIQAVLTLRKQGWIISNEHIYNGLKHTTKYTGLQGRWYTLGEEPKIICDTGHNTAGIKEVMQNINAVPHQNLHIIIGILKDKEVGEILSLFPANATYYFCQLNFERATTASDLQTQAAVFGLKGDTYDSVSLALTAAKQNAGPEDLIFIGGSTYVVAEVL